MMAAKDTRWQLKTLVVAGEWAASESSLRVAKVSGLSAYRSKWQELRALLEQRITKEA
jgi:hypothetical protein